MVSRVTHRARVALACAGQILFCVAAARASAQTLTLDRGGATVVVEPYAPNIVRVTLSLLKPEATSAPGYGITARPVNTGWTAHTTSAGDELRSSRMVVRVAPPSQNAPTGT